MPVLGGEYFGTLELDSHFGEVSELPFAVRKLRKSG